MILSWFEEVEGFLEDAKHALLGALEKEVCTESL